MPKLLLAAYATGIIMAYFVAPWEASGLFAMTGILLLLWFLLRNTAFAWAPFLGILLISGLINTHQQLEPPTGANHISRHTNNSYYLIEALVETVEQRAAGGYKILTEARQLFSENKQSLHADGKILLYIKQGEIKVRPGQVIRWRSRLRKPNRFGNPGEFDFPLYLAAKNIYVTAFVNDAINVVAIENHPARKASGIENLRLELAKKIEEAMPEKQAALQQSLLLGMRAGISTGQRQILAESGIAHLFAISGLHFGLLALLFFQAGKYMYTRSQKLMLWRPPQKVVPLLLIIPLAGYLMLTGNAWATRRAFLMVATVAGLIVCDRRIAPFNLLAMVGLVLLLFNPLAVFQAGFQLSFAGVAGILAWMPGLQRRLVGVPAQLRWLLLLFLTTLCATVATAPVLLWHFHQFSPAGLVTNLVAIPLIAWGAVPTGLCGLATRPFAAELSEALLGLSADLTSLTLELAIMISSWPALQAIPIYLTATNLAFLCGALICFLPLKNLKHRRQIRLTTIIITSAAAFFLAPQKAPFQVTAFSVGQGDATLISVSEDTHYLVDGGGLPRSSIDPGEDLIAPALGRMGITQLEGIIATHSHPDHSSGLTFIVTRFPTKRFYYAGDLKAYPGELQKALKKHKVSAVQVPEGWTEIFAERTKRVSLFVPDQKSRNINERSIITYTSDADTGVLLTADAGNPVLEQLKKSGLPGRVDLLKLPHHGSRHAQPGAFLKWLKPDISFVSAGRGNGYGFPHKETILACNENRSHLYRTDQHGMVKFIYSKDRWQVAYETISLDPDTSIRKKAL